MPSEPGRATRSLVDAKRLDAALAAFRDQVRKTRQQRGFDQYEAAERAGISQAHWSKIERGEIDPSLAHALRIQAALDIPSIEIFFGGHPSGKLAASCQPSEVG
jgi:transcriptional regulator with XRE-family HTH domain